MQYDSSVQEKLDQCNQVLSDLGHSRIQDNVIFTVNPERNFEHYVEFNVIHPSGLHVCLQISNDGFTVQMDRCSEIFDFSTEMVRTNPEIIRSLFKVILTADIEIRYYGPSLTKFIFHPKGGEVSRSVKVHTGLLIWPIPKIRVFKPIYDI